MTLAELERISFNLKVLKAKAEILEREKKNEERRKEIKKRLTGREM